MRKYDYSEPVVLNKYEEDIADRYGLPLVIPRRYEANISFESLEKDYDWQVTYKFPPTLRNYVFGGHKYGSMNMTLRRLYEILVYMNGNVSFIDEYLATVFPYSVVGKKIQEYGENAKKAMEDEYFETVRLRENGKVDKRFYLRSLKFRKNINEAMKSEGEYLEKLLKEDFINAMKTGKVPLLNNKLAGSTVAKKARLGFSYPAVKFVASEQFVNSIMFFCRLEKRKWQIADIRV